MLLLQTLIFGNNVVVNNDLLTPFIITNSNSNSNTYSILSSINESNINLFPQRTNSIQTTDSMQTTDSIHTIDSIQSTDSIQTMDSIQTTNSIQSVDSGQTMNSIQSVDSGQTADSSQSVDSSQTIDSMQNMNLIKSKHNLMSEDIINNEINLLKNNKLTNLFIDDNIYKIDNILNKNYTVADDDDNELITDPNTRIIFIEKNNNKDIINKVSNMSILNNIHHESTDDFIIFSNLALLSKIEPNQKLVVEPIYNNKYGENTKSYKINFEIKIDNSYVPKLTRWYYSQGRNETIDAINELINISIKQFFIYKKLNNNIDAYKYYYLLENSKLGLFNLKLTYNSDNNSMANIENILEIINDFTFKNTI